jgi:hypothetical protein
LNDGKPDQRHWRPDFTSQIFLRRAAAGNLQVPTFLQDLVASNSGTQFRQRKACHRYWKHILKKLMAPRILGKHLNEADHKPGPNPIKWVGLQEKQTPRTLTSTFLRACRALTALRVSGESRFKN